MTCSLNRLYEVLQVSKQGVHDMLNRHMRKQALQGQILTLVSQIRKDHPSMGIRQMYYKLSPNNMGRDSFEQLCIEQGLKVKRAKNFRKTTNSQGVTRFANLTLDMDIDGQDQAWNSDITYFEILGRFYYLTFIQDAFTRRIVGHSCSKRLTTEQTTLPALKKAIRARRYKDLSGLIFHSDGGGQYYDKDFRKLTAKHGMKNSMADNCYENAMAESLNGVIKNKYLKYYKINSFDQLKKLLDRAVQLYNSDKPHSGLNRMTPIEFEARLSAKSYPRGGIVKSKSRNIVLT